MCLLLTPRSVGVGCRSKLTPTLSAMAAKLHNPTTTTSSSSDAPVAVAGCVRRRSVPGGDFSEVRCRPASTAHWSVALLCLSLVCPLVFAGLSSGAADGYCLAPFNSQVGFVASRGFMELYTNDFDVYAQVGNTLSATKLHLLCSAAACRRSLSLGSASLTPIRGWRVCAV